MFIYVLENMESSEIVGVYETISVMIEEIGNYISREYNKSERRIWAEESKNLAAQSITKINDIIIGYGFFATAHELNAPIDPYR